MTRETVDRLLANHRENVGRYLHIEAEMMRLKGELETAMSNLTLDTSTAHNYELSDMPRGHMVGQPTEQIAIKLASGWKPDYILKIEQQLAECEAERNERNIKIMFVEGWLQGLPERERWLIETQVIDGVFWRDVLVRYHQKFGVDASKDTLQRVKARAMERIYEIAR